MALKLKQKRNEKQQLRIVSIVKELYTPYKFFLYGDIPIDFDFESKKGMIFCENNSLAGLKSCKRVVKTNTFINFDLCNDEEQLSDFQFLIDKIRAVEDKSIHELSMSLQNFQNRINAEKALNEQFKIIEKFDKLLLNNEDVEKKIFQKANDILDKNVASNPFIHYQIYRKTPFEFTTLRCGISIPGMQYFGISADSFEQSMLRDNHMPINRDEKGILLALRSLQKLNIDHAQYAKSGELINSEVQIKYKNLSFSIIESSKVYALSEFVDSKSESNYYLVLHHLSIKNKEELEKFKNLSLSFTSRPLIHDQEKPIKRRNIDQNSLLIESLGINQANSKEINQDYMLNNHILSNNQTQQNVQLNSRLSSPPQHLQKQLQEYQLLQQQYQQQDQQNYQVSNSQLSIDKDLYTTLISSSDLSYSNQCDIYKQPNQSQQNINYEQNSQQNIKQCYQKKAEEFISSYYDQKEDEIKKQQKFDKVLENMLKKKQQKLKVKLF